ncbi:MULTISPECIES: universal stress protein [Gammaproteobacteria]|uniref:universal stress protein n=1 Tax=Gammaproteobacteria TaxID=1236 RepID=UPI001913383C|nr:MULTISPECIES: universal stress protein [Gammaproteobacteria]MBK5302143.1 universal stress protein [Bacillus sp. TH86]MBK5321912.1 universal stress protein [Bacillus sp. TH59]MBK5336862.1 universal stress protein [Bacillus sp. TH57]MBK5310925.1 universal stress protein [Pseudomonas sp. TH71]MBK5316409.1 universal stress protein [Erwinia sp. TH79]
MSQTQRLLLIAPPAMTRTPAFDRAAMLARAMQLPLHIVAFDYLQALAVAGLFAPEQIALARDGYLQTHRQWLAEQAELMNKHGVDATSEVVWVQHPYEEILHFVNEMSLALIIKDANEESALKRVFFTPLDWQLLRDCPVPVHLVTNALNPRPRNVLAIVDVLRSEDQDLVFNDQIIDAATKLAELCEARIELVHVYDWTAVYAQDLGVGALPLATGLYEALGVAQHEVFAALAERHGVPTECRHFIEGAPLSSICKFAEDHHTDVIVMGTVQHTGLNKLLGTTAEQLLHRAPCSVQAIKPGRMLQGE